MFRPGPVGGGVGRCSDLVPGGEGVDVQTWSWGGGEEGRCSDLVPGEGVGTWGEGV